MDARSCNYDVIIDVCQPNLLKFVESLMRRVYACFFWRKERIIIAGLVSLQGIRGYWGKVSGE